MSPESKRNAQVVPAVRDALGDYHSMGIEAAFNSGTSVVMPTIKSLSPSVTTRVIVLMWQKCDLKRKDFD